MYARFETTQLRPRLVLWTCFRGCEGNMRLTLLLVAALSMCSFNVARGQQDVAPRSSTERPNVSAPGLERTLSGALMDAACSAIAEGRSDLTRTPRILPPRDARVAPRRSTERRATESAQPETVPENAIPDKYRDCRVKGATTSFALYADGTVYVLDRLSNQMMQEHMLKARSANRDSGEWATKTLVGTATSENVLSLRTIRK